MYDRIFKKFFYGTAAVYQDQYELFGNHQVMPVKIFWDYMTYWSLLGFIFLQDRVCDQFMYPRNMLKLSRIGHMNEFMQEYLRAWHRQEPGAEVHGKIDISNMPLIRQANERLLDDLDNRAFNRRFSENLAQVETLFWEIIDHVGLDKKAPFRRRQYSNVMRGAFEQIFQVTSVARQPAGKRDERAPLIRTA